MARLNDVNTTDIVDAIRLGCRSMQLMFNADDGDIPYFRVIVRPDVYLDMSLEDHVPGRHLNALLNAEDATGIEIDEAAVEKHARAAFFSFSGPLPLCLGRRDYQGEPVRFSGHNIREGFHALYPLVQYRHSEEARKVAEACIGTIFEYFDPNVGCDIERLESECGIESARGGTFVTRVGRAIGPLVKYFRATGYGPALELAILLKEIAIERFYRADGAYDAESFGTHAHSITCTLSSLAQLADLTGDSTLMNHVKAFFDNGLWQMRDQTGWSVESSRPRPERSDEGEMNNTGDILETALILGRWGYTDCYHDAERILRCHLLPSQLRDVSFMEEPDNPEGLDRLTDVVDRVRGLYGFPAPYGHEPIGNSRIRFNTDVVGGSVGSLCEAWRQVTRTESTGHWVNLLFDRETEQVEIQSPYTHSHLSVRVKKPAPLFVRIPPWVDRKQLKVSTIAGTPTFTNDYLFIPHPPVNRPIDIHFPLAEEEIKLVHQEREIRTRLRGDAVVAMENFGGDLTFFDPL